MHKTTRQKILEIIEKHQAISTQEIGIILGLTKANIRHHLTTLIKYSLIEIVGQIHDSRGRPTLIYGLSGRLLGDGMDILATILLEELQAGVKDDERIVKLKDMSKRLVDKINRSDIDHKSKRLSELVEKLNGSHISIYWQASSSGPQIIFLRCPYARIINEHPELCNFDNFILEEFLGLKVIQISKLTPTSKGTKQCVFQIDEGVSPKR